MVSSKLLVGKNVIDATGMILGQIESFEVGTDNWKISSVYLELSESAAKKLGLRTGRLGLNRPIISIPTDTINNVGDVVTIKNEVKDLRDLDQAQIKVIAEYA